MKSRRHGIALRVLCGALLLSLPATFSCDNDPASQPKAVSLEITCSAGGSVLQSPAGTRFTLGTVVTFTPQALPRFLFAGWSGDATGAANPLRLSLRANTSIHAAFAPQPDGMVLVHAAGSVFTMGSSSSLATQEERPPHQVRLSYDYAMDGCEVTQGRYAQVLGSAARDHALAGATAGTGDSLPIYNVNWYQAALFCNALSRSAGFDTVYTYTAVCAETGDCPYVLENIFIHYERFGYRLPTEAEWEFACRAGAAGDWSWGAAGADSAGAYAWYSLNSSGVCHPVGRLRPNGLGLYDMSGNVAEWVNDWLGAYPDSLVEDPVGPRSLPPAVFEAGWERPVRGGCWELGTSFLRSSARKGPYAAPAKLVSHSIGFRTVLGAFAADTSGAWREEPVDTALGLRLTCRKSDLLTFLGTTSAKLVFTRSVAGRATLCYLDFTEPDPTVHVLADTLPAICPTISPDGSRVAYGTRREGFSSRSTTTIRLLDTAATARYRTPETQSAYLPRWWVAPQTPDTFIIYTDGASLCGTPQWNQERTYRQLVVGGSLIGSPVGLAGSGSYHGGLSADGRFLATGYPEALVLDLLTINLMRYFVPPWNGLSDSVQVCNVSISPSTDNPDQILLLDFGSGAASSTLVGRPYGLHEFLFLCGSGPQLPGHVHRWYEKPAGYESWDRVEWSNHPDFAVGVAYAPDTQAIVLINLADSTYLQVLRGANLADPWWWTDPMALPQHEDPYRDFGRYDLPTVAMGQIPLTAKLKLLWKTMSAVEVAFFGSSPTYYGINPSVMSRRGINMGTCAAEVYTGIVLAQEYALRHCGGLRAVCLGLDAGFLRGDPYPPSPFLSGIGDSKGFILDKSHRVWEDSLPSGIVAKIAAYSAADWPGLDTLGYVAQPPIGSGWGTAVPEWPDYAFADTFVQMNLGFLAHLADTLASRGVHLLVVNFPENPGFGATGMAGRYGPSQATFSQIAAWLRSLEAANPYFHFYDAHQNGGHDYTDAEAMDMNHLNALGARKLTHRIDSLLTTYGIP